ncbi:MAG: ribbon-helix-helix protein, CopG family [Deferribacteres bacterium]|nr:ribbon-helix-helix protein, CopG family [Deferribacteres bacterium]
MVRINTILTDSIIEELDKIARYERKSRSSLLREAAERFIEEHKRLMEERLRKERMKNAINVQDRLRKKSGEWNGTAEVRKWREIAG